MVALGAVDNDTFIPAAEESRKEQLRIFFLLIVWPTSQHQRQRIYTLRSKP